MENGRSIATKARRTGEPKHARMRRELLNRIRQGGFKPGDAFATEQELIRQYGVSSTTARRCLNDLAREGFLVRRRGSGTYISEMATLKVKRNVGILCSSFAASLHTPYLTQLLADLERSVRELDWRMGLITTQGFESAPRPGLALAETVRQQGYDGLFIASLLPERWIRDLYESGLPLVAINVECANIPVACILTDAALQMRQACDYLYTLGHRRLAVFLGQVPGIDASAPSAARRGEEALKRIQAGYGPEVQLSCAFYDYGDHAGLGKALAPLFAADAADRPTAVIAMENSAARVVEDCARAAGWTIPDDLSIVMCESGPSYTSFTAVVPHVENLCWRAVRIMEGIVAGHMPVRQRELVGCDLVVRASTAPLVGAIRQATGT